MDIYLDNNATTMVAPGVVQAMLPFFTEQFGNPSSMHSFGNKVGFALKQARSQVQALLGGNTIQRLFSLPAAQNPILLPFYRQSKPIRNAKKSSLRSSNTLPF